MLASASASPGTTRIVLGRNFRSRAEILEPAVRCVATTSGGREGADRDARRRRPGARRRVRVRPPRGQLGRRADRPGARPASPPGEILVLARTGYATEPVQPALARAGIPHRVLGSLGLYERTEVRDALAYLTLLANPADAQAFRRAVGSPQRGVGAATANRVVALRARHPPRRPDRRQRARQRARGHPPARPRASGSTSSATDSSTSAASCAPDGRSATSSSPP